MLFYTNIAGGVTGVQPPLGRVDENKNGDGRATAIGHFCLRRRVVLHPYFYKFFIFFSQIFVISPLFFLYYIYKTSGGLCIGEKDITEKNLEAWNDVFADIVNVLLFKGKRLIKENDLEADTKDSMFKIDGKIHEQERDVSKFWKNGEIRISILGLENQTEADKDMPLRVISYDGASYKQQLLDEKAKQRYPVTTIVLYFGTDKKWVAPKHLRECFYIPEDLLF